MNRKQRRAAEAQNKHTPAIQFHGKTYTIEETVAFARKEHSLRNLQAALELYDLILAQFPDYSDIYSNRGHVLHLMKRYEESLASYDKAIALNAGNVNTHYNRGLLLHEKNQYAESLASFEKAGALKPDIPYLDGLLLSARLHLCKWQGIERIFGRIAGNIDADKLVSAPFDVIAIPLSPTQQKKCAEAIIKDKFPPRPVPWDTGRYSHEKIRIGYFSEDFQNHATAYLMAELFELHDRSQFEITGFSFGAPSTDAMRTRLETAFDRFIDISSIPDSEAVTLARKMEIDIAISLRGSTHARTGIFALRAAPVQVNYLGYPGTMGASYIDYLIADPVLIPEAHRKYYTEKIAYLPDSYQVNDSKRKISEKQFTRQECGLPEKGFVFCSFNNNYKITPDVFDSWTGLLHKVPDSVLWLYVTDRTAALNLRNEARIRGIAENRLVFATHMELPDHLARHRLADLFLDTFYCNAHTTASDALWAGLPVLTCLGETFAGRVSASLLNAIGLPELVTRSRVEYEALAFELADNPQKLSAIRQKLAQNKATHPLFDTKRFTRHIEDAYIKMWERHQMGMTPDHIHAVVINQT